MKKQKSIQDLMIVAALIVLCIYVFVTAGSFKGESGMFPRIVAAVTLLLCCLQLGVGVREYLALRRKPGEVASKKHGFVLAAGTLVLYAALIFTIGYYPATAAYLCGSIYLFGYRKKLPVLLIGAGMIAFVYVLFHLVLRVRMPGGLIF